MSRSALARCAALALTSWLVLPPPLVAQTQPGPFRVQLHVSADEALKARVTGRLTAAVQPLPDVVLVERNPEYVLSLVILPTTTGGFAVSVALMNVHTDEALDAFAQLWGLGDATAERLRDVFRGSGALVDQRVVIGADLDTLATDVVSTLSADTLARARQFRR